MKLPVTFPGRAALLLLVVIWIIAIAGFLLVDGEIPTHFDFDGSPTSYSSRFNLFWLPVIATLMYWGMSKIRFIATGLNTDPWRTVRNPAQAAIAWETVMWLRTLLLLDIAYLTLTTVMVALGEWTGLGSWFTPVFLVVILGYLTIAVVRHVRADDGKQF